MKTTGKIILHTGLLLCVLLGFCDSEAQNRRATTDSLRNRILSLNIPGLTINNIQILDSGDYQPAGSKTVFAALPAFCIISARLQPTPASDIGIELWMPLASWNGRFLGTGNGGGAGKIAYNQLAYGLKKGYATANTDMGTSPVVDSAIGNRERWIDFGYRSTHLMTVVSKQILKVYYGKAAQYNYFVGCSTGGQQALMEAQRYPDDYNGIIAGAPANNRTHLHSGFLFNHLTTLQTKGSALSTADLSYINKTIVSKFAGRDGGAPSDSFLTDPRSVKFNIDSLFANESGNDTHQLTNLQLDALKKIYAGPLNPHTGESIYTGPPPGSETTGGGLSFQQTEAGVASLFYPFRWVFGANFNYASFDFDKHLAALDSMLAPVLNANNPDLSGLQKAGGKLIMYSGTADALVPFQDAIHYYERVVDQQRSLKNTQRFFRYFILPGMAHCGGGPGINDIGQGVGNTAKQDSDHDILLALVKWVEHGVAPDKIIASSLNCCAVSDSSLPQRPVYPYPKFPKYTGGDVNAASSYKAANHKRGSVVTPAKKYLQ